MLQIENLHVAVEGRAILNGINLEVNAGEVHAIMGPNGSGKSTLAGVLAGREGYVITEGHIRFEGEDLTQLPAEQRARRGIFLGFQYPVELPGVSNLYFLKAALNAGRKHRGLPELDAIDFLDLAKSKARLVGLDEELVRRPVNVGFSGGEKKRNEIFQMAVLEPKLAILDEIDSGLDIDALKVVSDGVRELKTPKMQPSSSRITSGYCVMSCRIAFTCLPADASFATAIAVLPNCWNAMATHRSGCRTLRLERRFKYESRSGSISALEQTSLAWLKAPDARNEPAWLSRRRQQAKEYFVSHGLPSSKDESFRFLPLNAIASRQVQRARAAVDEENFSVNFEELFGIDWVCRRAARRWRVIEPRPENRAIYGCSGGGPQCARAIFGATRYAYQRVCGAWPGAV